MESVFKSGLEGVIPDGRAQVLSILRKGPASVKDIATTLNITPNGVRAHIATLGREGLIETHGRRRGARRPEVLYRLSAPGEELFPKAYALLLEQTLGTLRSQLDPEEYNGVIERVGRDLADRIRGDVGAARDDFNLERAIDALKSLGAEGELVDKNGSHLFVGTSCPLAAVAPHAPEVCRIAATLLESLTGLKVVEECDRGDRPRCLFMFSGSEEPK